MSNLLNKVKSHLHHHDSSAPTSHPVNYGSQNSYAPQTSYAPYSAPAVSFAPQTTSIAPQATSIAPSPAVFVNPSYGSAPALHQTSHRENVLPGPLPNTVALKKEDHWEGANSTTHESVTRKEIKVEPKQQKVLPALPIVPPLVPMAHSTASTVQTSKTVSTLPTSKTTSVLPASVDKTVVEKATIVKETFLPEERIEIQPVIHREREQKEIHKVVQPLHEKDIMATKVVHTTLPEQVRKTVVENDAGFQARSREVDTRFASTKEYAALKSQTVQKPAIVEEHVHKTIIEEVQPVLYRETIVPVIVQETQPIYEKIVEAPVVVTEERSIRELGTRFAETSMDQRGLYEAPAQSFVKKTTVTETFIPAQELKGQQMMNPALQQKTPLQPNINSARLM